MNAARLRGLRMYTENVDGWIRRLVAVVALVTFATLPASGVVCALVCAPPSASAASATGGAASHAHHDAISDAGHHRASGHTLLRVSGPSGHACGDHASIRPWTTEVTTVKAHDHGFLAMGATLQVTATAPSTHRAMAALGHPRGPPGPRTSVLRL